MIASIKHILICLMLVNLHSYVLYGQDSCMEKNLNELNLLDNDSITRTVGHAFIFKKRGDMPFYEEFSYTFKEGQTKYYIINKSEASTQFGVKLFNKNTKELTLNKTIIKEGKFEMYGFKAPDNGKYDLIIYSKNPDNSCASVTQFVRKAKPESRVKTVPGHFIRKVSTDPQLELLKSIDNTVKEDNDMPYYNKVKFIFTKGTNYYLIMESNKNLRLQLINLKNELIPLNYDKKNANKAIFISEQTGIYDIVIYQKDPLPQNMTLDIYKDKSFK